MKNTMNYIAPEIELFSFSSKEACMITTSGEAKSSNISFDFDELSNALNI